MKYNCEICSESFNNKIIFNKHHKVHTSGLKCPLCEVIDVKPALIQRFTLVHNIDINIEHHDFKTIEEFNSWKKQIEEENTVFFSKRHGTFKSATYIRTRYQCHRSGTYQREGKGLRHLKIKGSKRINAFCPASIILDYTNGIYNVKYTSTHIGHTNELCHISLPKSNRLMLADKLANKIPFETIIEDIKGSLQDSNLERIHLVTKQDLRNIKRDFNLNNSAILNTNDAESVDLWVQKLKYTSTPFGHKNELCHINLPEKDKLILADNTNNGVYNIEYPEKLQRKKKKRCKEILSCKNNGTSKDGCESQIADESKKLKRGKKSKFKDFLSRQKCNDTINDDCDFELVADDTNNRINTKDPETLEPIKKKQYKEILSRHKNVAFIKDNCDTQDDANIVHEIKELETLQGRKTSKIQEFLSRFESIDDAEDNLEKRETLEELKEKMKRTFLDALDKATTYEQCELIRKIIAPLHPTLDRCISKGGIEEKLSKRFAEERTQKELDPTPAKCIPEKGTEVLDPMLAKCILEQGIEKELDHMSAKCISKEETQKKLVPTPSKCNPEKGTEVLDPMLAKYIPEEGIKKELDHMSPISKKENEVLDPALPKCILDDGKQKELYPTPAKCILEKGTVEELDPTLDESKNRLNCEQKELITPTLDVLKNPLNCDEKQSAIKLNYKPLAYKCIFIKKKS